MGRLPWTLADFPAGYELYLHKSPRPRPSPQTVPRRDFLLYGKLNALPPSPHFTHLKREKLHRLDGRPVLRISARIRVARRMAHARRTPYA